MSQRLLNFKLTIEEQIITLQNLALMLAHEMHSEEAKDDVLYKADLIVASLRRLEGNADGGRA